jgi:hypothetical protein
MISVPDIENDGHRIVSLVLVNGPVFEVTLQELHRPGTKVLQVEVSQVLNLASSSLTPLTLIAM